MPPDASELLDELPLLRNAAAAQMQSHRAEHAALVASLAARGAAYSVSFEEFVRLAMLVFSRSFCLRRETGEGGCENLLLPGFDMCNTAEQATATRNAAAADGALPRRVEMRAMGDVRAGDEFVIRYFNTATPRNDVRFLKYGIVVDDDLRLLAVDTRVGGAAAADGRPLPSALERHVLRAWRGSARGKDGAGGGEARDSAAGGHPGATGASRGGPPGSGAGGGRLGARVDGAAAAHRAQGCAAPSTGRAAVEARGCA